MAKSFAFVMCLALVLSLSAPTKANNVCVVGGVAGWGLPVLNIVNSLAGIVFHVGDELVFNYLPLLQNVIEVTAADYAICKVDAPIFKDDSGCTTITFDKPGTRYFTSDVFVLGQLECRLGLCITITVYA